MFNNLGNGKLTINAKIKNALSATVGATANVKTAGKVIFCIPFRVIFLFLLIASADLPLPCNFRKKYLKYLLAKKLRILIKDWKSYTVFSYKQHFFKEY